MKLAGKVRPGDAIEWCGRVVTVEKVGNALHQWTRPAVYLWCRIDGAMKRLHYYADEPVDVREADSEPPAEPACEVRGRAVGTGQPRGGEAMSDILSAERIKRERGAHRCAGVTCRWCMIRDSHEALRSRLAEVEAERREAVVVLEAAQIGRAIAESRLGEAVELLRALIDGAEDIDPRLRYVVLQPDREDVDRARAFLAEQENTD